MCKMNSKNYEIVRMFSQIPMEGYIKVLLRHNPECISKKQSLDEMYKNRINHQNKVNLPLNAQNEIKEF